MTILFTHARISQSIPNMARVKISLTVLALLLLLPPSTILFVDGLVATTTNVVDTRDTKTWRRKMKRVSSCSPTTVGYGVLWPSLQSTTSIRRISMPKTMPLSATSPSSTLAADDDQENDRNDATATTSPNPSSSSSELSLLELLSPSSSCRVNQMSGTDLAYVGDVVYELFIRSRYVWPSKRTSDLQNRVVSLVNAEYQSKLVQKLRRQQQQEEEDDESSGGFLLTQDENQVLMRGRNSVTRSSKNRKNPAAYQDSTAFECLVGYMYINNPDRCTQLLSWLETVIDTDF